MSDRRMFMFFVIFACGGRTAAAQTTAAATIPAGSYLVRARDSSKTDAVAMAGWPFELKGNGTFTFTEPSDSLTWSGKLVQKDGIATYTDQGCGDPGTYVIHQEQGGYVLDLKAEACPGRDSALVALLFVPKPKK